MYSFVWKPRWLLSHVLVLALIVTMIMLMFWQLRRLDEKKELNALMASRADGTPALLADVLAEREVRSPGDGARVDYRSVTVTGTYLVDEEFTIPSRTLNGAAGRLLITPMEPSAGGPQVLVMRGFIPQAIDDDSAPIDGVEPPSGEVTVTGWARKAELPGWPQPDKVDLGDNRYARMDIARLERARDTEYLPVYVELATQAPPTDAPALTPYPLPERGEGPHFSYAVQWGIFTTIALVGYPLVLRRVARGKDENQPDDVPSEPPATMGPDPDPDADRVPASSA